MTGTLYLLPNSLGNEDHTIFLPPYVATLIPSFSHYIVENTRNARRFIKSIDRDADIDAMHFYELNKRTSPAEIGQFIDPLLKGNDMGLISEAGLPGVADPGAQVVALAHKNSIRVKPLTGPSSVFLSLMASGLNGQSFRFTGYLPIQKGDRIQAIRQLEKRAVHENETQVFIETPYRNDAMFEDLVMTCHPDTLLTIAVEITTEKEEIRTMPVGAWKKKKPELNKRPAVFLIGKKG